MRKLDWDYTSLADAYVKRPDYADEAIDRVLALAGIRAGARVLDLGAGAGHLTIKLAERGLEVVALEPNASMRKHGVRRTGDFAHVRWVDGVMEKTGEPSESFTLCAYGSSFGVTDRAVTLREAARLAEPGGWFACLFNHRDLEDPLQREIETFITEQVPGYRHGSRRADQAAIINASGLFGEVHGISVPILHEVETSEWIEAWYSHATLQRQAGERFAHVVAGIGDIVRRRCDGVVRVPYTTRGWAAPRRVDGTGFVSALPP